MLLSIFTDFYLQEIQYGIFLGSPERKSGKIVKVHSRHVKSIATRIVAV